MNNNLNERTSRAQRFIASILFSLLTIVLIIPVAAQPAGYGYGKQITVDATEVAGASALTNFPIMVRFQGASASLDLRTTANGGFVENANGYDIVFTSDASGATVLDHQIEYYNGTAGEFVAWVRIPTLSHTTDTDIYMFYGNCAVAVDPSTTNVWNTDYDAVYFLHDDFDDYTANGYNGTNTGSVDVSPAIIGDGQTFGPVTGADRVEVPSSSIASGQGTVSIWANASSFSANHQYMIGHTSDQGGGFADRIQLYTNDATGLLDLGLGDTHLLDTDFFDLDPGNWYYITLTWDGSNYAVYVNGALATSGSYTGLGSLATILDIGNDGSAAVRNESWVGDLDHARLSNEIFGADWIQTEYNNQQESSTFYTVTDISPRTFYSLATGDWDANTTWSFTSDGSSGAVGVGIWPGRNDNVVIRNGHTVTINATDDNNACGISANALGRSNVGNGADPFTGAGDATFYHTGDILISNGATLSVSEEFMIEGYTLVEDGGTLSVMEDVINLGYLEFSTSGTFDTTDDLILTGNSVTIMDNTSTGTDDLYIEWTDATLCGEGAYSLGGGAGATIQYFNGASDAQICSQFTVECPTMDCTGVPAAGTGTFISGNEGLGGVGDSNSLQLWLRADDLSLSDASSVTTWSDVSGNGLSATASGGAGTEPTFNTNTVNTSLPSISFDEGDFLDLGQPAGLDFVPGTDSWSFFIVYSMTSATEQGTLFSKADGTGGNRTYQYTIDDAGGAERYFSSFIGGNNTTGGTVDVSTVGSWHVSSHSNNTTTRDSWTNENADVTADAIGTNNTGAVDVLIGARRVTAPSTGFGFPFTGRIAELAMYDGEMTEAQRVIITNYLAAKYNIVLGANDVYTEDDNGFDYQMIGIGQASDGTNHLDSKGPGVTRIWNPSDLDNSEYLMTGHDNVSLLSTTKNPAEVDGTVIQQRLSRIWGVSETGDVGTISVSINFGPVGGNPLGSNLRLLIDRDGDFSTNDVTPIVGSISNNVAVFSNVDFQDGDQFTLGNTDASATLPVELLSFHADPAYEGILLSWETATEINNDFFTIERSVDGAAWEEIGQVSGSGTTTDVLTYHHLDNRPLKGGTYYRLKQTDFDGQFEYFNPVYVWYVSGEHLVNIFPNPSKGVFRLRLEANNAPDRIQVFDISGKSVRFHQEVVNNELRIDLSTAQKGTYLLRAAKGQRVLFTTRLVVSN